MVREAAFLQRSDPLDVSEVQAPDAQTDITIIYSTVSPQNAFTSDSEEQGVFTQRESEGLTAGRGCQPPWE